MGKRLVLEGSILLRERKKERASKRKRESKRKRARERASE
jgi:hypothetical protein